MLGLGVGHGVTLFLEEGATAVCPTGAMITVPTSCCSASCSLGHSNPCCGHHTCLSGCPMGQAPRASMAQSSTAVALTQGISHLAGASNTVVEQWSGMALAVTRPCLPPLSPQGHHTCGQTGPAASVSCPSLRSGVSGCLPGGVAVGGLPEALAGREPTSSWTQTPPPGSPGKSSPGHTGHEYS